MAVKPEIRYRGNHQKHPPNPKVLEVVGEILVDIGNRLQNPKIVSAVVEYDDDANRYKITFACEGRIFVSIWYTSGQECSEVQKFGSSKSFVRYFASASLMEKAIIPLLSDLLKTEVMRTTDLCVKLNT